MVLLVCILKNYRYVEELLLGFLEHGITGATVVDARGMGQIIGSEIPIFAGLRGLFPGSAADTHMILSAMTRDKCDICIELMEEICGPLSTPGSGIVFTLPVETIRGLKPEIT
jgi:hypothetical protein